MVRKSNTALEVSFAQDQAHDDLEQWEVLTPKIGSSRPPMTIDGEVSDWSTLTLIILKVLWRKTTVVKTCLTSRAHSSSSSHNKRTLMSNPACMMKNCAVQFKSNFISHCQRTKTLRVKSIFKRSCCTQRSWIAICSCRERQGLKPRCQTYSRWKKRAGFANCLILYSLTTSRACANCCTPNSRAKPSPPTQTTSSPSNQISSTNRKSLSITRPTFKCSKRKSVATTVYKTNWNCTSKSLKVNMKWQSETWKNKLKFRRLNTRKCWWSSRRQPKAILCSSRILCKNRS